MVHSMSAMASIDTVLDNLTAVVVTGGSSGIGKSFIEHIGRLRPSVRFCNLSRTRPSFASGQLNVRHIPCDLTDRAAFPGMVAEVLDFLKLDAPDGGILLINNSGFGLYGTFPQPSADQHRTLLDLNVGAVLDLTAALLPALRARGGAVVTVASTAAFQPTPYLAAYGATKAFVLHWSLALNEELRGTGVYALAVCPGPTATDFFRRAGFGLNRVTGPLQSADDVVREAWQALASGRSLVVTGWRNRLMTTLSSALPKPWVARIARRILARTRLPKEST